MKRVVSVVLLSCALLAGCGDDDGGGTATDPVASDTPSSETSPPAEPTPDTETSVAPTSDPLPDWPACAEVWVADARLPGDYQGCVEGETPVKAENQYCEFGKKLVTYADQYWAVRGGKVNDAGGPLGSSQDYADDLESCLG